ncbi:hypothetical protein ACWKSP_17475 [Micromonosporaceae bacterium Da 78-11]
MSTAALLTLGALMLGVAACGGGDPATAPTSASPAPPATQDPDARAALAGLAALAQDHAFAGLYSFDDGAGQPRNVVATVGADGSWKVDVAGGALGGTADVSIVSTSTGVHQCTMSSPNNPITPTCVKIAEAGKRVPKAYDPKVQRLFRQWLTVFTDRQAALSVTAVQPLSGARGDCFSVDSSSASLKAPVDVGIYCYGDDGLLTAARVEFGVVKLLNVVNGPATVPLPGPEVSGEPMGLASPPAPPPVVEPSLVPTDRVTVPPPA